jgi:hypothetical protein
MRHANRPPAAMRGAAGAHRGMCHHCRSRVPSFLNSADRMPQAESGQRSQRDGYDLRIFAGLGWFSMLAG